MQFEINIDEADFNQILQKQCKNFAIRFLESCRLASEDEKLIKEAVQARVISVLQEHINSEEFKAKVIKQFSHRLINSEVSSSTGKILKGEGNE